MSKGYTINFFINVIKNTKSRAVTSDNVYNVVAPRYGQFSVKSEALDYWLNFNTADISEGRGRFSTYGKTPRARLLTALKNRKVKGTI